MKRCTAWIDGAYCNGEMKQGSVTQNILGRVDQQPARSGDTIGPNGNTVVHDHALKCKKCGHTISDTFLTK